MGLKEISCNPNITMEIISNNPDKQWDWDVIPVILI